MSKGYYHTKDSVQEYIQMAKDVNSKGLIEKFKTFLKPQSSILELGSGPGTDWNILQQDFRVTGSDNSLEFLRHLKESFPKGEFLELDAITLDTNKNFEGIYANKVLFHLSDEELKASLLRQQQVLLPKGVICHSYWKGKGEESFKGMFVNYHDIEELKGFYAPNFEVLLIEEYKEFEKGNSIVVIARKK